MTDYDSIPYHYASFKASHNSYAKDEDFIEQIGVETKAGEVGCRGLELDLHRHDQGEEWSVSHLGGYTSDPKKQFLIYLWALEKWSSGNPDHDPVTLHLDLKGGGNVDTGADALDKYLKDYLGDERIFTPGDLMGQSTDLVAKAMKGWPTIGDLRGQILICLTGAATWKKQYSEMDLKSRLCFSDFNLSANSPLPDVTSGTRVFANMHHSMVDDTTPRLRWLRDHLGFVSRVYEIDSSRNWRNVQKAGANIIATNRVRGSSWASVGDEPFASTLEEHAPI